MSRLLRPRALAAASVTGLALLVTPVAAAPASAGPLTCVLSPTADECVAPETRLTAVPATEAGTTTATDAAFGFEVTEEQSGTVTFECRLEGPSHAHDWTDCTDPEPAATGSRSYAGLAPGQYTFSVRASEDGPLWVTPNVEQTPETFTWSVVPDTTAPGTVIDQTASRWHAAPFVGITYHGTEPAARFVCTWNGRPRTDGCGDGMFTALGMGAGDYTFTVAAVDAAGNEDPTPAESRWTVPLRASTLSSRLPRRAWRAASGRGHYQEQYVHTTKRGATLRHRRTNVRSLALVATSCPSCGRVRVSLGSQVLRTVDLRSATTHKRRMFPLGTSPGPRSGVVSIEVLSSGKDVYIEGLGVSAFDLR